MASNQQINPKPSQPTGVQHDSETPVPQKPSFLLIVSTSLVVLTLVLMIANLYQSMTH